MLRRLFLALSRSQGLREFVVRFPIARRISRRFVAGETLEEAGYDHICVFEGRRNRRVSIEEVLP